MTGCLRPQSSERALSENRQGLYHRRHGLPRFRKSTLVDRMVEVFRKEGKSVGIVAVDPPVLSPGCDLGRSCPDAAPRHGRRSLYPVPGNTGCLGGLTRSTQDIVNVMDAMARTSSSSKPWAWVRMRWTSSTSPTRPWSYSSRHGDEIQAIKAGIIEIGEIFVINKSDREGTDKTEYELRLVLEMERKGTTAGSPPSSGRRPSWGRSGEVVSGMVRHHHVLMQTRAMERKLKERAKVTFLQILQSEVMGHFTQQIEEEGQWENIVGALVERRTDPYSLAQHMMGSAFGKTDA